MAASQATAQVSEDGGGASSDATSVGNLESEEDVSPVGLRLIQREYFEFIEMLPKRGSEAEEVLEQSGLWTEVKTEADTKDLMKSGTSSVVLLSYRWRSASHPDPDGTVLACVKEFLAREENAAIEHVFWDYLSVSGDAWDTGRGPVLLEMANRLGLHFVTLIVGSADYFDSTWCTTEFVITMMNPRARTVVYDTAERDIRTTIDGMPYNLYERVVFGARILQNTSFTDAPGQDDHLEATGHLHTAITRAADSLYKVYGEIGLHLSGAEFVEHAVHLSGAASAATALGHTARRFVCVSVPTLVGGLLKDRVYDSPAVERCKKGHPVWYNTGGGTDCWICMLEPPHGIDLLRKYRTTLPAFADLFHAVSTGQKREVVQDCLIGLSGKRCPDVTVVFSEHSIHLKEVPSTVLEAVLNIVAPMFAGFVVGIPPVDLIFTFERATEPPNPSEPYITFKELSLEVGGPLGSMVPRDWTQTINNWIRADYLEESVEICVDEMASADHTLEAKGRATAIVASARRRGVLVGQVTARLSSVTDEQHPEKPPVPTLNIDSVVVDQGESGVWTELRLVRVLLDHCRDRWTTATLSVVSSGWMERVGARLGFTRRDNDPTQCVLDAGRLPEYCGRPVRPRTVDGPWKVKVSDPERWEERPVLEGALGVAVAFDSGSNSYDFRMGGTSYWVKAPNLRLNGNE